MLTEVVLNQKSASQGTNKSLKFIPGNNFLGIAASSLYPAVPSDISWLLFHSGQVRFGDAHPSLKGKRSLQVPNALYYPKLGRLSEGAYVSFNTDLASETMRKKQLKQCRSYFYSLCDNPAVEIAPGTSFAVKSAYNREMRRAEDEKMFGYESLDKGSLFYFEIESDDEKLLGLVDKAICGKKHIGRSRTAQYGLVEIKREDFAEVHSRPHGGNRAVVYADGRLIFLDEYGLPTFRPSANDLGFSDGRVIWEDCQIRTFQYAPWNFKRQCFDTDHCGFEKGSVFVVETDASPEMSQYVGSYNNEGFGKVIYNPAFLDSDDSGAAVVKLSGAMQPTNTVEREGHAVSDNVALLQFLRKKAANEKYENLIYKEVNKFVKEHQKQFKDEAFASQWGAIRALATQFRDDEELKEKLFGDNNIGFLKHGVAQRKWNKYGRAKALEDYFNNRDFGGHRSSAVINLASEMAKTCKMEEK